MASSRDYLEFILEQCSLLEDISYRYMMGEFILYYKNKIFGGIYDDRFLVKVTSYSKERLHHYEIPYPNAKEMLMVDEVDDREFIRDLVEGMYDELPKRKK